MVKTVAFCFVVVVASGCSGVKKGAVWNRVVNAPRATSGEGDRSSIYARGLHSELEKARIPHKVVTYQYPFSSKLYGTGTAERTSVIYRDDRSAAHPWWLMDEQLSRPLWLPTVEVGRQVSFFLRRPATIVSLREYAHTDGKAFVPIQTHRSADSGVSQNRPWLVKRVWQRVVSFLRPAKPAEPSAAPVQTTHVAPVAHKAPAYRIAITGLRGY